MNAPPTAADLFKRRFADAVERLCVVEAELAAERASWADEREQLTAKLAELAVKLEEAHRQSGYRGG